MKAVVTQGQMRAAEKAIMAGEGVDEATLMERAAHAVAEEAARLAGPEGRIAVLCGKGSNGGDGLAAARIFVQRGRKAAAFLVFPMETLSKAAREQLELARAAGVEVSLYQKPTQLQGAALIVDALFGIGLQASRPMPDAAAKAIRDVNNGGVPILAVDLPSGVEVDTGRLCAEAVWATETVTFQYAKRGLYLYPGRSHAGSVTLKPITGIELPPPSELGLVEEEDIRRLLPPRRRDAHKGDSGRALLLAGSEAYTGAALMSAAAALRAGAGVLTVAVPGMLKGAFAALPEAVCRAVNAGGCWDRQGQAAAISLLEGKTAVALGPGMGRMEDASLAQSLLSSGLPAVIDADGLNHLAACPELKALLHPGVALTPHPGEMSRLTGQETDKILLDPVAAASEAAMRWNCTVLLKGAVSCIASPDGKARLNVTGNAGLAKGGSGDVLTGLILAFLSQGLTAFHAAAAGAYLLGASADKALELLGCRMLLSRDVIDAVAETLSGIGTKA